ncbi:MAG: hypothetical protein AB1428_02165 [Bacteroidota bacterium]
MKHLLVAAACAAVVLVSCAGGASDLAVVNKVLKKDTNASMAGGPDMGMSVPSSGSIFWVEGSLKNNGKEEAKDVTVAFRVTDGNTTFVLSAVIPSIQPGKAVAFRTPPHGSRLDLRLIEEEPEISVGK